MRRCYQRYWRHSRHILYIKSANQHRNMLQRRRRNSRILSSPHQTNTDEDIMVVLCKNNWSNWLHQAVQELYRQKHNVQTRSKLTSENVSLLQKLVQKMRLVSFPTKRQNTYNEPPQKAVIFF